MNRPLPTDWVFGEDLAQLREADREQVFAWLRACGVNPDRTRAIRLEAADLSREAVVVAEEYVQWPITVGRRGIEMRTEAYVTVGDVPRSLTEQLTTRRDPGPNG
jgi:hypothetical protein